MNKTEKTALCGMLIAVAMVFSYVESLLPPIVAIPGIKLGLSNIISLVALYLISCPTAITINIIRILLSAILFGSGVSLAYSLAGGILSLIIMIVLYKANHFSIIAVSIAGGVFHNIGQLLMAVIILGTSSIMYYLVVLWFTGILTGALIGLAGGLICRLLPADIKRKLEK